MNKEYEWNSVEDSVPEKDKRVLMFYRDRSVQVGYRMYDKNECDPSEGWYSYQEEKCKWCKYWMPLPEKPKVS